MGAQGVRCAVRSGGVSVKKQTTDPLGPRALDLTGRVFTRLRVIRFHSRSASGKPQWECLCDCGETAVVLSAQLVSGGTRSCGCLFRERVEADKSKAAAAPIADLIGRKFGHLTVLATGVRRRSWRCSCDCGKSDARDYEHDNLVEGRSKSCGCSRGRVNPANATTGDPKKRKQLPLVQPGSILGGATVVDAKWTREHGQRIARLTISAVCACGGTINACFTARSIEQRLVELGREWLCSSCRTRRGASKAMGKSYLVGDEVVTMAELSKRGGLSMEGMRARLRNGESPGEAIQTRSRGRTVLFGRRVTAEEMAQIAGVPAKTILDRMYKQRKPPEVAIAMPSNHHNLSRNRIRGTGA
jgi:hypothetical protein